MAYNKLSNTTPIKNIKYLNKDELITLKNKFKFIKTGNLKKYKSLFNQ